MLIFHLSKSMGGNSNGSNSKKIKVKKLPFNEFKVRIT